MEDKGLTVTDFSNMLSCRISSYSSTERVSLVGIRMILEFISELREEGLINLVLEDEDVIPFLINHPTLFQYPIITN